MIIPQCVPFESISKYAVSRNLEENKFKKACSVSHIDTTYICKHHKENTVFAGDTDQPIRSELFIT